MTSLLSNPLAWVAGIVIAGVAMIMLIFRKPATTTTIPTETPLNVQASTPSNPIQAPNGLTYTDFSAGGIFNTWLTYVCKQNNIDASQISSIIGGSASAATVTFQMKDGSTRTVNNPTYQATMDNDTPQFKTGMSQQMEAPTRTIDQLTWNDRMGWVDQYGVQYVFNSGTGKYDIDRVGSNPYYYKMPLTSSMSDLVNLDKQNAPTVTYTDKVMTLDNGSGVMVPYNVRVGSDGSVTKLGLASAQSSAATATPQSPGTTMNPFNEEQALAAHDYADYQQHGTYIYVYTKVRNYDYGDNDPRGWIETWTGYYPDGSLVGDVTHSNPTINLDPKRYKVASNGNVTIYGWRFFSIAAPAGW